ncbi:hypothetical protein P4O66_003628 [Electrophorus voltai]|uniref:Uncharacterized protein n=1 Tax=Electrophorus voltai TaxID=2609070 RepID=A0AAD9E2L7_9TELE|nr:hypothetical protein P4O66_003628 [Electrophorus voltai]
MQDPPSSWPHSTLPPWGKRPLDNFGGPPEYGPGSDSKESYRPQPDYEDRHTEVDSAGSYNHFMDFHEGYADYGEYRECSDVSLLSEVGFDYGEDPSMEVEEVLCGDPPNSSDMAAADFKSEEAPARQIPPKALPRRHCLEASKPS